MTSHGAGTLRIYFSFPYTLGSVGVGNTALQQINSLAKLGHDVHVVAPRLKDGVSLHPSVTFIATREFRGHWIPGRIVNATGGPMQWHDRHAARLLRSRHRRYGYDIVHTWPLGAVRTQKLAVSLSLPIAREAPNTHTGNAYEVVAREASALGISIPPENSHFPRPENLAREEQEWASATAILAPSDAARQTFLDRGFPPEKVQRHRYGCELPPAPDRHDDGRPFTAVFLGAVEPRKGLHIALRAWSESGANRAGRFLIAGRFMPGYREVLGEMLDDPSIEELGFVEHPLDLLAEADVLLLPSIEEGSAIVTYEAQAVGCIPLVSYSAGAFLEDGVQGLVHPTGDQHALAEHLRAVNEDADLRDRLRRGALAHRDELSWDAAAVVLEAAYRRIIALKAGSVEPAPPLG